ncbi:MAG TPA: hypothetical protein VL263_22110 [Vicinamibacterales bacterium]|nr:hypothetical protein [Vicinamibacterales bacterium]
MRTRQARAGMLPALLTALLAATVAADGQAPARQGSAAAPAPDLYAGLTFRNIGPSVMGGRIDDLAVLESNPAVFYVGAATGGLWRTINNGTTWEVLFDDIDDVVSIGDIAIPPNDANTIWVGSGENNNRQSTSWGNGVYKSTDAGHTWKLMGLSSSRSIGRIIVDPVDHDVVYVAALGSVFGPSKERGVFKTTDGGLTWSNVLFVNEDTGATELVMDPANNKVLYAATYQRRRAAWGFNGGGPGSAIYKSSDAGRTWTKLTRGIPTGPLGRIGLDVYRANPNVVYARIEHEKESGVYRSDDAGLSWRKMSSVNPRPMYFSQIRIDPTNDLRIYVLGVELHLSDDGGKTFIDNGALHSDHHAMWIDPNNPNHIIDGNDGGVGISYDKGASWEAVTNMDLGQFYHVAYDMQTPYHVCGGLQDNYTWCGPSAVRSRSGIGIDDWRQIQGGDGFDAAMDPRDGRTVYAESQDGNIVRVDRLTGERKSIRPVAARGEPPLRWNWNTPIVLSAHNADTIYVGANKVFKSTDRGQNWTAISPDLTQNTDRETLSLMGQGAKEITIAKNDGVQSYGNLVQLVESPKQAGVLYAGSDDGTVYMTKDDGKSWTNITNKFPNLPKDAYVSRLAASTHEVATVYATFDNHRNDDYGTFVYASADGGNTFRSIGEGIPKGHTVTSLAEDPKNPSVLYTGTEFGLFVSLDRGGRWERFRSGLPTVPIHEIVFHPRDNDMIIATHGRSIWILDDATPVQHLSEAQKSPAFLFDLRPAMQFNPSNDRGFLADRGFWGKNPTYGAPISYYLATPAESVAIRIRDAQGTLVRELTGNATRGASAAGVNRIYWDLRHEPLPAPEAPQSQGGGGGGGGPFGAAALQGPNVLPGEYRVTLVVAGKDVATKPLRVSGDTALPMSETDRKTWHDTSMSLHQMQRTANEAADALTVLSGQITTAESLLKTAGNAPAGGKQLVEDAAKRLADLRRQLGTGGGGGFGGQNQPLRARIGQLKGQVVGSTSPPTAMQVRSASEAREDLTKVVQELNDLIAAVPQLYDKLGASGLKPAALKAVAMQ